MILLPSIKDSGSVNEGLTMQFEMLKKCGLRRHQRLPVMERAIVSSFRRFFMVDSL